MVKLTNSKGKVNAGLASSAILGAAIPLIVTVATGGVAAVPIAMWIALGSVVSGLLAGTVEVKPKRKPKAEAPPESPPESPKP